MEMKWHPIVNGNMNGIPRDEYMLFTVLNKVTGEVRTGTGMVEDYFIEKYGYVFIAGVNCPIDIKSLKAWAELPEPYKPKTNALKVTLTEEEQNEVLKEMRETGKMAGEIVTS